jgi:hypothetical protein
MFSGLPGRLEAVLIGLTGVALRCVVAATAGWIGAVGPGWYFAMTDWQALLSWLLFWIMQAVVRARSGMVAEQTRKASSMQADCSSDDWAMAAALESNPTVKAIANVIRLMEVPFCPRDSGCFFSRRGR